MNRKHVIYPIFLPHSGCSFRCVYCDQVRVTSQPDASSPRDALGSFHAQLGRLVEAARKHPPAGEVAVYGGTFTALPREHLIEVLNALRVCVDRGDFSGIRFSTRPDGMSDRVIELLRGYPVRTVELGVQSFRDEVLRASERGYDAVRAVEAAAAVKAMGWELGIQLMPGLPGDSLTGFRETVHRTVTLKPQLVRIYPTVVIQGTRLASWFAAGRFVPLSLEEALDQCAWAYGALSDAGIPVARMGLHGDPELLRPGHIVAGPFHPAFGYLVRARWWRNRVDACIGDRLPMAAGRSLVVRVPERRVSEVLGPGRENLTHWKTRWGLASVQVRGESAWTAGRLACEELGAGDQRRARSIPCRVGD